METDTRIILDWDWEAEHGGKLLGINGARRMGSENYARVQDARREI